MATSQSVSRGMLNESPLSLDVQRALPDRGPVYRSKSKSSHSSSSEAALRDSNRPISGSNASRNTQRTASAASSRPHTAVRTLPPWIVSVEDEDLITPVRPSNGLLAPPSRAHAADHHHGAEAERLHRRISHDGFVDEWRDDSPNKKQETGLFGGHKEPVRGRKWDHARDKEPVILRASDPRQSSWGAFIRSSAYGPPEGERSRLATEEELRQQTPGYEKPWRGDLEENQDPDSTIYGLLHSKKKRKSLLSRIQDVLIRHPLVPLIFRVTVFTTSVIALGISGSLHHLSNTYAYAQTPSITMAIVVDCVAIPYILYITYDEYTGKPLGLRSPKAKIRLILLDLFFVIFESANLALAFASLTDKDGSCQPANNGVNHIVCARVKALCSILMIALVAWITTFVISIFRLVERINNRENEE